MSAAPTEVPGVDETFSATTDSVSGRSSTTGVQVARQKNPCRMPKRIERPEVFAEREALLGRPGNSSLAGLF